MNKIVDAFDQISEELHHQYSLGYYPDNTNWDGRFRKIEVVAADHRDRVTAARATMRSRLSKDNSVLPPS